MIKKILSVVVAAALAACLFGCGQKEADLHGILTEMNSEGSFDAEAMQEISADDLTAFYGIETADVKQFAAEINGTGIKADEIVLIEAADADAADRVKEKLEARYESKKSETEKYLPDEYAVILKCSVDVIGNYVTMIVAPDADGLTGIFEDAVK